MQTDFDVIVTQLDGDDENDCDGFTPEFEEISGPRYFLVPWQAEYSLFLSIAELEFCTHSSEASEPFMHVHFPECVDKKTAVIQETPRECLHVNGERIYSVLRWQIKGLIPRQTLLESPTEDPGDHCSPHAASNRAVLRSSRSAAPRGSPLHAAVV